MQNSKYYPPLDLKQTTSSNRAKGLWNMMAGFRWLYIGSITGLAVAATAKILTYLLLRRFTDTALEANGSAFNVPTYYFALGFLGLALFEAGFTFISGKLAARSSEGIVLRLRNFLYDHLQRLPFKFYDHTQTGQLIQRASSDIDAVRRFFIDQGTQIGRISTLFGINVIVLMVLNAKLAVISLMFVPIIVVVSIIFFKKIGELYEKYQDQDGKLSATLQENLSGVRVVKAFARQDFEMNKFEEDNFLKYKLGKRLLLMHALYWPITDIICGGQMLLSFYVGARMAIAGTITLGTYLAFANLIIWIIWPMRNLGRLIAQGSTGLVSYSRVAELIDETQEDLDSGIQISAKTVKGDIEFKHVGFEYEADTPVLQDISFKVKAGQSIALIGATGSGKTSLINLLPRFYPYTSGSITLDGVELKDYGRHALRQQIGIVNQEPFLFSRTIRENIAFGVDRKVSQEEIEAAASAAAIHTVIESFPNGYDTLVGERGVTLSGGQKQRITIARTLLKDPRILILDDSTSSVDTETEAEIREALDRLMAGRTTFIIAHRIQTVMRADQILVFSHGKLVQRGKHSELINQDGLYKQIYDIQAQIDENIEKEVANVGLSL